MKVVINRVIAGLVETGLGVNIITQKYWPQRWHLKEMNVHFIGIGTLCKVCQRMRWVFCIGPEGHRGRLKPYLQYIAINLWGHDLLQQWNTQINIPPVTDAKYIQPLDGRQNIVRHYGKQIATIQTVHKKVQRLYLQRNQKLYP